MKTSLIGFLIAFVTAGFATVQYNTIKDLQSDLQMSESSKTQLLAQVGKNTTQRLAFEEQIAALKNTLLASRSDLTNMSDMLSEMKDMINPDFERLKEQARLQIEAEMGQSRVRALPAFLTSTENTERMAKMAVTREYGYFLSTLDVSEERKEEIEQQLIQLNAERMKMSIQMAMGELTPEEAELSNGDYFNDALAEIFTPEELDEYEIAREIRNQRNLRLNYEVQLADAAPQLSGENKDLVIDALVAEMSALNQSSFIISANNSGPNPLDQRMDALNRVRVNLQDQLNIQEMAQFDNYLQQQIDRLSMTRDALGNGTGVIFSQSSGTGIGVGTSISIRSIHPTQ